MFGYNKKIKKDIKKRILLHSKIKNEIIVTFKVVESDQIINFFRLFCGFLKSSWKLQETVDKINAILLLICCRIS